MVGFYFSTPSHLTTQFNVFRKQTDVRIELGVNISVVETIIYDSQPQIKRGHKEELLNFDYGIHLRLISVIKPFSMVTRVFSWKKSGLLSFIFSM